MKALTSIVFIISFVTLSSCGNSNKNTSSAHDKNKLGQATSVGSTQSNPLSIYNSLSSLGLPLKYSMEFAEDFAKYKPLNEKDYHLLTDIGDMQSYYDSSATAIRLPQKDNLRFILTCNDDLKGDLIMELYSLSDSLTPLDKLQIYSIEEVDGGSNVIAQTFEIDADYRITVSKHLNGTLIEQLTYIPTYRGAFEEIRDGKTLTVAFESFDNRNYTVETFIWDHNSNGGLVKKDLKTQNYLLTETGHVEKTDTNNRTNSNNNNKTTEQRIKLSITPVEFNKVPESISLRIENHTKETLQFGADYEIEKLNNGKWIKQPLTDIAFIAIMYMLEPGKTEAYNISLYPDKIKYTPGQYRIRKNILTGKDRHPYYVTFRVVS